MIYRFNAQDGICAADEDVTTLIASVKVMVGCVNFYKMRMPPPLNLIPITRQRTHLRSTLRSVTFMFITIIIIKS